jgi:glycosyltransferase involved in cell wall biosynthesis
MRIALMMGLAPRKLGSGEAWVEGFCEAARRRGHQVDVFGRLPIHPRFAQALRSLGCGWGVLQELEQDMFRAARLLASRYQVLHLNLLPPRGKAALIASAAWPARVLFMFRSDLPPPGREPGYRVVARRLLDPFTLCRVWEIGAVSRFVLRAQQARFGFASARSRVIYNGVNLERFQPRPCSSPARPGVNILTVANLRPHKGVHHAIGALSLLRRPDVRLRVVGDGPEAPRLQALAQERGVASQVEFLGLRNDVHVLMNEADFFVHPSLGEGFGLTVAEAMASGRAVVASRVGGIPELIEHGHSGLLVQPGDEEQMAVAIRLLISSRDYRGDLEQSALQRVRERFDVRTTIAHHVDWCEEAFASRFEKEERRPLAMAAAGTARLSLESGREDRGG